MRMVSFKLLGLDLWLSERFVMGLYIAAPAHDSAATGGSWGERTTQGHVDRAGVIDSDASQR